MVVGHNIVVVLIMMVVIVVLVVGDGIYHCCNYSTNTESYSASNATI